MSARAKEALRGHWRAKALWVRLLEGVSDAEQKMLVGYGADELQAYRQASGSKTARDGNGRDAG